MNNTQDLKALYSALKSLRVCAHDLRGFSNELGSELDFAYGSNLAADNIMRAAETIERCERIINQVVTPKLKTD